MKWFYNLLSSTWGTILATAALALMAVARYL
jgi:hypothetical protein